MLRTFFLIGLAWQGGLEALPFQIPDPGRMEQIEKPENTFVRSDQDKDGSLTFAEFLFSDLPYVQLKQEEFDALDTDHDGHVSRTEYETHVKGEEENANNLRAEYFGQLYDDFDEDFDLKLNEQEVRNVLQKRFLLKTRPNFGDIFKEFDRNGDGGLDLDEYIRFDREMPFHELDPLDPADRFPTKVPSLLFKQDKLPMMKKANE